MRWWIVLALIVLFTVPQAHAQTGSRSGMVRVSAIAGGLLLSASGSASPRAEVSLYIGKDKNRSATADEKSAFTFVDVPINRGLTNFCLETKDVYNLGVSLACFSFSPAQEKIVLSDIYLPPTIGLDISRISEGQSAVVLGYSLPLAGVEIRSDKGLSFKATTDSTGKYRYEIKGLLKGTYHFSAYGYGKDKRSVNPMKSVTLTVNTRGETFLKGVGNFFRSPLKVTLLVVVLALLGAGVWACVRWRREIMADPRMKKILDLWLRIRMKGMVAITYIKNKISNIKNSNLR